MILWARDESEMQVFDPGNATPRRIQSTAVPDALLSELSADQADPRKGVTWPTYLSPGVYVEEVPAQSKPIEGVGTSIAAFVGLAPGGPVNTPMRISNWTQFARLYGDPATRTTGRSWRAHTSRTRSTASSRTAARSAGSSASAATTAATRAAGRTPGGRRRERRGVPCALAPEGRRRRHRGRADAPSPASAADGEATRRPTADVQARRHGRLGARGVRGPDPEEGPQQSSSTKVNAASKLIKLEETGSAPCRTSCAPAPGTYRLSVPAANAEEVTPGAFEGDVAKREGIGGLAAVDEITMVCCPRPDDARRERRRDDGPRPPGQADRPLRGRRATAWRSSTRRRTCSRRTSSTGA